MVKPGEWKTILHPKPITLEADREAITVSSLGRSGHVSAKTIQEYIQRQSKR